MTNPSGKRRKLRRSVLDTPYTHDEEVSASDEGAADPPPPPLSTGVTTCQRCSLPLLGEAFLLKLEGGETRQNVALCEPCSQSLTRWLRSPTRASHREALNVPTRRRKKPTEVADSLISRRRSSFSKKLEHYMGMSGPGVVVWLTGALMVGVGLIGLFFAFLYAASNLNTAHRRR